MAVLVFAGLVTSSEPIRVWSQDTATAQEAHTMKIKVSTNSLRVSDGGQMVSEWKIGILIILVLISKKKPANN